MAFYLVFGLRELGALQGIELRTHDAVKALLADPTPAPDVVIVSIDDNDIGALGGQYPTTNSLRSWRAPLRWRRGRRVDLYRDRRSAPARMLWRRRSPRTAHSASRSWERMVRRAFVSRLPCQNRHLRFSDVPVDDDGVARRALLLVSDADGYVCPLQCNSRSGFLSKGACARA